MFSLFINGDENVAFEAIRKYREGFNAERGTRPQAIIALAVVVADTEEEAESLVASQKLVKIHLSSGKTLTLGTREQAEEFGRSRLTSRIRSRSRSR